VAERVVHSLVRALQRVPELAGLPEEALLEVVGASVTLFWPAGSTVFAAGEPADGLYVVLSGCLAVEGGDARVAAVGPGDYVGERSLLRSTRRSHTVVADEDAELLVVPSTAFRALLEAHPEMAEQVHAKLRAREAPGSG
jgi:NTE family protein